MSEAIDFHMISSSLRLAVGMAERARYEARGATAHDRALEDLRFAEQAVREFSKLEAVWPRARDALNASERAYDRYVTSGPERCCSCHISAPCSFCCDDADPDNPPSESQSK